MCLFNSTQISPNINYAQYIIKNKKDAIFCSLGINYARKKMREQGNSYLNFL